MGTRVEIGEDAEEEEGVALVLSPSRVALFVE
jgi:hypothetical protein